MTGPLMASLFDEALHRARELIEKQVRFRITTAKYEVHAPVSKGRLLSKEQALSAICADDDLYFRIIDISIKGDSQSHWWFLRVSGHTPSYFSKTFNPSDLGPFKIVYPYHALEE